MYRACRFISALLACLLLVTLLCAAPLSAQDTEDSRIFLTGFNAFQQKDYPAAITSFDDVLLKFPESPLRDMTLFWLARAHYNSGNRQDAARYMAQFNREYPDNPLKNTVEDDLLTLATKYEKEHGTFDQRAFAKAEAERRTAALAAQQAAKAESERLAHARAEADRLTLEKAQQAKREQERLAAAKVEADRLAQAKAQQEAAEKAKAEAARLVREKAKAEQLAVAKAEAERQAREKIAAEQDAAAKLAAERQAQEKAQQVKREQERLAAAKVEADRLAQAKAQQEADEQAKAEAARVAQAKAHQEAAEKAKALKAKAEAARLAREKAEAERRAAEKAEAERVAAKAEAERQALAKAEAERKAKAQAEAARIAAVQAAEQRQAAEKAAAAAGTVSAATEQRPASEATRRERMAMREKAISEYKNIIERFPGTAAAKTAANRLKDLGVAVALPQTAASQPATTATSDASSGTMQTLTLEVAQYAAFDFDLQPPAQPVAVAQKTAVPFELQNRGNGQDSFYLATGFPAEFGARFAAAAAPEQIINQTPLLAPGETFRGLLLLSVPAATIDGLRISYPVKAASQFMGEASQSRIVPLVAAAPLLRAVVKTDKAQLVPGEKAEYTITVLNVGSNPAEDVTLRLNYPAQYQPVEGTTVGFRQEMQAALVLDGIHLKPGESKNLSATFQLKEEALAKEELLVRADLINNSLQTRSAFLSNAAFVLPVSDLTLRMAQDRVTAVPGQIVSIPARVINKGNQREQISLVATAGPFQKVTIYHDLNRDGLRQPGEPEITTVGPLGPKEEAALLLEVTTPKNARDGAVEKVSLSAAPEAAQGKMVVAETQVAYSRPVLHLAMKGREGRMVPGELLTVELDILNQGSNLAKQVELELAWPAQVELVAADQTAGKAAAGSSVWRFNELGAGEKRVIKASFRIKSGTGVGTGVQLKSMLTYQDQAGNRY